MSEIINAVKSKFEDQGDTSTAWAVYNCPWGNLTWLTAAILKIATTSWLHRGRSDSDEIW